MRLKTEEIQDRLNFKTFKKATLAKIFLFCSDEYTYFLL